MQDVLADFHLWTRALHIIFVIAWMAGLLYLPRLFVYHCGAEPGSPASEMLKVMERRLLRAIMTPAMIGSFVFGGLLLVTPTSTVDWGRGWIYVKLALVVALSGLHVLMVMWRRDFAVDRNTRSAKFYRFANEMPTVVMIAIVIMAVVKPF
jgi:putative membrane protein